MSVQTVSVQLAVPQESKALVDALLVVAQDVIAKKPLATIAGDALPKALAAAEGFSSLSDELKAAQRSDAVAYLAKSLMDALAPGA